MQRPNYWIFELFFLNVSHCLLFFQNSYWFILYFLYFFFNFYKACIFVDFFLTFFM